MKAFALSIALTALASAVTVPTVPQKKSYDGYKVFRLTHEDNHPEINDLIASLGLATWKNSAKGGYSDIVVPPSKLEAFQNKTTDMAKLTMHEDLGESVAAENIPYNYQAGSLNATWWTAYHAYADHLTFINDLMALIPNNSEIFTSGKSVQGRDITGIHFWGTGGKNQKPAMMFHSTVHAREWVTTMVNEYIAYQLITGYSTNSTIKTWVDKYDWYFIPVVNPDGFTYTQTTERLWRKNRQTNTGATCMGRDINRNWDIKWNMAEGASTNPCAEDYKGAAAADAPETVGLASFVNNLAKTNGLKLYVDWHSYSQLFMYPYGYSCTSLTAKSTEFDKLSRGAVAAIKAVYGTPFQYGPICSTIYQVSGGSVDYVNDVTKADYTFTLELRDTGKAGFVLPPAQIQPSATETWEGVKYILSNIN